MGVKKILISLLFVRAFLCIINLNKKNYLGIIRTGSLNGFSLDIYILNIEIKKMHTFKIWF